MPKTSPSEFISYRDVKAIVLKRIRDKVWAPDTILPNESDLAVEFCCTRTTVNRAMRALAEEGYIERKRKAGTRVLKSPTRHARFAIPLVRDAIESLGAAYRYTLLSKAQLTAPDWLSTRLGLVQDQKVVHLQCLHFAENAPYQFEDRWINAATVPNVLNADFNVTGPNEWLIQEVPFTDVEMSFGAVNLDSTIAQYLNASAGAASFMAQRTTWLDKQVVTFVQLYHAPGHLMTTRL